MGGLRIAPVGVDAARFAVENWHYSRTLPVPPRTTLGVWEHGKFIGVVIFSRGASAQLGSRFGAVQTETCELTRVALNDHESPVSRIVAIALRVLKKHSPGLRLVVSFADPYRGHHGGIYQAGNWIYTGETLPSKIYFDKSGRQLHSRQVSTTGLRKEFGEVRVVPQPRELREVLVPGKHRYVMPLDRAMRKHLQQFAQPYPPPLTPGEDEVLYSATCRGSVESTPSGSSSEVAGNTDPSAPKL